jgi:hypothetical protein
MPRPRLSEAQLQRRLEACRADYEATKAALAEVGFICEGSLAQIYTCCRNPNCRCADPARRHGPYWQLTWKQDGKTVSRRLSAEEARLYAEWIDNRRQLEAVIAEMRSISRRAGECLLADIGKPLHGPARAPRPRRSAPRRRS